MYKILRNVIPQENLRELINYLLEISKNIPISSGEDSGGRFLYQRLSYNQIMSCESIKKVLFSEDVINKIKENIGDFYLINYVHGIINSFSSKAHRDGQSFGFSTKALKKSSKIIKVLFYFNLGNKTIQKGYGLDVNYFDFNIGNIFLHEKISLKINYYFNYYLRSRLMKTLNFNMGDVILMDNNCWHRASVNKFRPTNAQDYKIKKILLDYEIVTDKEIAIEYAKYCRDYFVQKNEKNDLSKLDSKFLDKNFLNILNKNNIKVLDV